MFILIKDDSFSFDTKCQLFRSEFIIG